jgi:hypothetical protein
MITTVNRADALAERLIAATLGALELCSVYFGAELGLHRTLAGHGSLTAAELAERAGVAPRYAPEWLEQQAVAGLLDTDDRADKQERHPLPAHPAGKAALRRARHRDPLAHRPPARRRRRLRARRRPTGRKRLLPPLPTLALTPQPRDGSATSQPDAALAAVPGQIKEQFP